MNYLVHEKSAYLKAHAHQPVLWYPWGEEAFQKAWNENKPIIISIGYQACHWCHVMARECFEDPEVARVMNKYFVCIKVDREERPDVDQLYMDAVLLTGRPGGWPLNCFALPDARPFYGVTYLPKARWLELVRRIGQLYENNPGEVRQMASQLAQAMQQVDQSLLEAIPDKPRMVELPWGNIIKLILRDVDWIWGGDWSDQKFPMVPRWLLSLRLGQVAGVPELRRATYLTLDKMAEGAIFDVVEGGFMRYATDRPWRVPHFEKMLYDNGLLLVLYSEAYRSNPKPLYERVIRLTARFLIEKMRMPNGLFAASFSAESEGQEGLYYSWTLQELIELIPEPDLQALFCKAHGICAEGNWQLGRNLLYRAYSDAELATETGLSEEAIRTQLETVYERLRQARTHKVAPFRDDAAIISWNAYAIWGIIEAYKALNDMSYLSAAYAAAHALMPKSDDLNRVQKEEVWYGEAFAEDYAALALALIHLYTVSGNETYLEKAKSLTDRGIELFYDQKEKVFCFTSQNTKGFSVRRRDIFDTSTPSSNALFAEVLSLLRRYYQHQPYASMLEVMLARLHQQMSHNPILTAYAILVALREEFAPLSLIYRGTDISPLWRLYEPRIGVVGFVRTKETHIPLLAGYEHYPEGKWCLCLHEGACRMPVSTVEELAHLITAESKTLPKPSKE